jgi:hypothetical protein
MAVTKTGYRRRFFGCHSGGQGSARCEHCGYPLPPLARPGRKYCSDRCRKRAQRHLPYTGSRRGWTPRHPADEPPQQHIVIMRARR